VPEDVSQEIAEYLNHASVTQRMISFGPYSIGVFTEHILGGWGIRGPLPTTGAGGFPQGSDIWECYQEIAGTLLAMPMPTKE